MPEGDTIFRTATVLRRTLVGGVVRSAQARPGPLLLRVPDLSVLGGFRVASVEARGKQLLMTFDDGRHRLTLRTHMRMSGAWHRYRPGEAWRLAQSRATVVLETDDAVAVCFDCPTVELLTDVGMARSRPLRTLGPDLLGAEFDADVALANLQRDALRPIGEVLLDQRRVAGIGNVVRNEALFMTRMSPWRPIGEADEETLRRVVLTAQEILARSASGAARVTTGDVRPGARLFVYRRAGRPCRRCGTLIRVSRQTDLARRTYWCPNCQGA
jgi:endonuclease VIII